MHSHASCLNPALLFHSSLSPSYSLHTFIKSYPSLIIFLKMAIQMSSLSHLPTSFPSPKPSSPTTTSSTAAFPYTISKFASNFPDRKRSLTAVHFQNGVVCAVGEDLPLDYASWFPKQSDPICRRRAGVLLHPTSFPGPYGIGDLGPQAFRFLDWLHRAGCSLWQVTISAYLFTYLLSAFCFKK